MQQGEIIRIEFGTSSASSKVKQIQCIANWRHSCLYLISNLTQSYPQSSQKIVKKCCSLRHYGSCSPLCQLPKPNEEGVEVLAAEEVKVVKVLEELNEAS